MTAGLDHVTSTGVCRMRFTLKTLVLNVPILSSFDSVRVLEIHDVARAGLMNSVCTREAL